MDTSGRWVKDVSDGADTPLAVMGMHHEWRTTARWLAVPDGLGAIRLASDASGDVRRALGTLGCVPGWWTMVEGPNDVRHVWGLARGHGHAVWYVWGILWACRRTTGAVMHHGAGSTAGDVFPGGEP